MRTPAALDARLARIAHKARSGLDRCSQPDGDPVCARAWQAILDAVKELDPLTVHPGKTGHRRTT